LTTIQFLKLLRDEYSCIPCSKEGAKVGKPSNSELVRWCKKNGVFLNGVYAQPKDEVFFPVSELTFFNKNDKARCSVHMIAIDIITVKETE
jgi:hypothetical protein